MASRQLWPRGLNITGPFFSDVVLEAKVASRPKFWPRRHFGLEDLTSLLPSHLSFPAHNGSVLNKLAPLTADEVHELLSSSLPKSSNMDIIPTSHVLRCQSVFSEIIARLANLVL